MTNFTLEKKTTLLLVVIIAIIAGITFYQQGQKKRPEQNVQQAVELTTYDSDNRLYKEKIAMQPKRVIAVWQTSVETLLALGEGDKIIAAIGLPNDQCLKPEYREAFSKIPYKSFNTLNLEATLAMQPDFILTSWASTLSAKNMGRTDFWNQRHVGTYISEVPPVTGDRRSIEHEYKYIRDMGRLFGVEDKAEAIINEIESEITGVVGKLPAKQQKKQVAVIQFMGNLLKNWGSDYLQGDIVAQLHGELVMPESKFISYEDLLAADPEIIFLMANEWEYGNLQGVKDRLLKDRRFASLQAVKSRRVYIVPLYLGQYSAVRLGEGIRLFAQGMYPEFY